VTRIKRELLAVFSNDGFANLREAIGTGEGDEGLN